MTDRRLHAVLSDGRQVVRYERQGKWYVEAPPQPYGPRSRYSISEVIAIVKRDEAAEVFIGVPGGSAFDRAFKK
jgi:hypothetical protein